MGAGIFGVLTSYQPAIREWVAQQDIPAVVNRAMYSPSVFGWAVLDGGVTEIYQYGLTSLPTGIRIVGWQTLRLLIDELDLVGPKRPLPGEMRVDIEELRRLHRSDDARGDEARRRAELLATCVDGQTIREVADTLLGRVGGAPATPFRPLPADPKGALAGAPVGPWLSGRWVERQLHKRGDDPSSEG